MQSLNSDFDQLKRYGELQPVRPQRVDMLGDIKEGFRSGNKEQAFEDLCDLVKELQKKIDEMEGKL